VLARDLHAFVHGLELDRVHLVGHSLGGAVALEYALSWPETLASVALVAPASGDALEVMRSRNDAVGMIMRWTDPTWLASRLMLLSALRWERFLGTRRDTLSRSLAKMMPSADPASVQFDALLADALAIDEVVVVDTYEALRRWDVRARLPELAVPVRVLAGGRDTLMPPASLEVLTRALPCGRLEVWDDVGHSPQLEKPAEFAAWLARVRPGPLARVRGFFKALHRWLLRRLRAR
jgi:pimeloyl-ACP methyl ester carboxylesterase